jgi:hypothetical protein
LRLSKASAASSKMTLKARSTIARPSELCSYFPAPGLLPLHDGMLRGLDTSTCLDHTAFLHNLTRWLISKHPTSAVSIPAASSAGFIDLLPHHRVLPPHCLCSLFRLFDELQAMSSKSGGEKAKEPRDGGGARCLQLTAKRHQKSTHAEEHQPTFLLLQAQPEILSKIYSFLTLREALVLRQTHRQCNETANDIFQYCFIMNEGVLKVRDGLTYITPIDIYVSCKAKSCPM